MTHRDKTNLALIYFIVICAAMFYLFSCNTSAQYLTQDNIREVLILQGNIYPEYESLILYDKYLGQQNNANALISAFVGSAVSGVALGSHESFTFGYKEVGWLPGFMQDWYKWKPQTEAVFGKSFTWQKIFRDIDYVSDRYAWNKWKMVFKVKEFFSWQALLAYASHWTTKNLFATFIRDKFKHDTFFYSFEGSLILP